MIRRNFLKAICASPLALLAKKPKAGCSVVDCQSSKVAGSTMCAHHRDFMDALIAGQHRAKQWREYAAKRCSGTGFSAKRWADNGCPEDGVVYVTEEFAKRVGWNGQPVSWMQIPGEARCYVENS